MGVDERFAGVAGFGYVELVARGGQGRLPARQAPLLLPAQLGVAGPGMADTLSELMVPGLDLCQLTKLLGRHARLGRVQRVRGHLQPRPRDVRGRRAGLPRRRRARARARRAAPRATGWIVGLFDAEPILRSSVARQTGIAVSLEREHAAVPENRVPTGAGPAFRTLSETLGQRRRSRASAPCRRGAVADAAGSPSRPTAAGRSRSPRAAPAGLSSPAVQATLVC